MTEAGETKPGGGTRARRPQEEQGVGEECGGKLGQRGHGLISVLRRSPWLPCGEAELVRRCGVWFWKLVVGPAGMNSVTEEMERNSRVGERFWELRGRRLLVSWTRAWGAGGGRNQECV